MSKEKVVETLKGLITLQAEQIEAIEAVSKSALEDWVKISTINNILRGDY